MATVSKNAQAMMYFLEERREWLGHTRLVKLLYLADMEARKVRGAPISSFEYVWHHHGPWDTAFFAARGELLIRGLAEPREVQHTDYTDRQLRATDQLTEETLTAEERHILHSVVARYMQTPLSTLLNEVVYKTPPMMAVESKGDRLPMETVDNTDLRKMGASLAAMLEAEASAESGDFMLAEDFFSGLLAEAAAADPGQDSKLP